MKTLGLSWKRLALAIGGLHVAFPLGAAELDGSSLAVAGIVAPRNLVLHAERPRANKPVVVIITNRGGRTQVIPDAPTLERWLGFKIAPWGSGSAKPVLVPPRTFPFSVRPGQKRSIVFRVAFELGSTAEGLLGFDYSTKVGRGLATASEATETVKTAVMASGAAPAPRVRTVGPPADDNGASVKATPIRVAVKDGKPSDPITFSAKWPGKSFFVSGWESTPADPVADPIFEDSQSPTVKSRWQNPGNYTVQVFLIHFTGPGSFEQAAPTVDVHVVKMTFKDENGNDPPSPLRVGITTHGGIFEKDRSKVMKVKVEPQSEVGNVEVKAASGSESRLRVFDQQVSGDTITFKVEGIGTEGSKSPGDAKIEAKLKESNGANSKVEQEVSVVRPAMILPQLQGQQYHENIQLNALTVPSDPRIPGNLVYLVTFHGWFITVPVRDQFGDTIGDSKLYLDAPVYENFLVGGELQSLKRTNIKVSANSSYVDPVGVPMGRGYPSTNPSLINLPPFNSLIAAQHVANPTPAYGGPKARPGTREVNTNTLQVEIATFPLKPLIKRVLQLDEQGNLTLTTSP